MRKRIILLQIYLIISLNLFSQNQISNGSFELFVNGTIYPPQNYHHLDSVLNWSFANVTCDVWSPNILGCCHTPNTGYGYQIPRTGTNYCGGLYNSQINKLTGEIIAWQEIPQVHIDNPLIQGVTYRVRAFISNGWPSNGNYVALDSFGFIFSDTAYSMLTFGQYANNPMPFPPSVLDTSGIYYSDTTKWYEVSGEYTAHGGEEYLILAYFLSVGSYPYLPKIHQYTYQLFHIGTYNLFDDVAIWPADTIPPPADAGQDTTICQGGKARLGSHSYSDYIYEWWPAASLSNNSGGVVWASPNITTTYYLQATDDIYTKTVDSVTVFVNNCGQNDTTVCVEQAFVMGSSNNPSWQYQWSPSTYLSSDTIATPQCTPLGNQLYHLLITNAVGDTIAKDSTHITVGSCYNASAGLDSLLCKGDSLQIGMQQLSFLNYSWSPNFMISDTTIGNPVVWPDTSTLYVLQLEDTLGRITYDTVWVGVQICQGIEELRNKSKSIVIQPNPAQESIQIRFVGSNLTSQAYSLQIVNLVGEILQEVSIKSSQSINISSLASGTYIVRIISEDNVVQVEKLVKL